MGSNLFNYLHDHLAGATAATNLLSDLEKSTDVRVAALARELLPEISAEKKVLEDFIERKHASPGLLKTASAWIAEHASKLKLSLTDSLGIYEAVEALCLGVLGKRSLWTALQQGNVQDTGLDLTALTNQAVRQHERLEHLRLSLAARAFGPNSENRLD
jgi:hypothetical protein